MTVAVEPIFESTEQALYVSFLLGILPATAKSPMQQLVEQMMSVKGQTQEISLSTVNFGGMNPLEIRGQCAMICGAVGHHTSIPEAAAIRATYAYRREKAEGVRCVRDYCQAMLTTQGDIPTLAIAWGVYGTHEQLKGLSVRKIAESWELAPATVGRDRQIIKDAGARLMQSGISKLAARFRGDGLIF